MHTTPDHNPVIETATNIRLNADDISPPSQRVVRALIFLPISLALIMTGFGIIVPVFPQRLEALGLGAETLALMEGAFGLGMFLFSTPMGILANRYGRKPLIVFALIGFVLTNLMLAYINIPTVFLLARFLEGAFVAGFMPASMAMIGDVIPQEKQGRWMGVMTTAQAGGIALGPAVGGVLYQAWGFTGPFLISAGFALISLLLVMALLPETLPAHVRERARAPKRRGEKRRDTSLLRLAWLFGSLLLLDFGASFIYPFSLPQYPFFFEDVLHYSATQYGLILSAFGLTLAVFPIILGRLGEQFPKKWLVVIGSLLGAALNASMLLFHQYPLLVLAAVITGIGSAMVMPALGTIYLNATNDQNRSQVMGIRSTALSMAMLLAPLSQAVADPWITPETTFAISSVLSVVMTIFALMTLREIRPEPSEDTDL